MEKYENETIAAIATALSDSGIGIVRISGEDAIYIVDSIFRSPAGRRISDERYRVIRFIMVTLSIRMKM